MQWLEGLIALDRELELDKYNDQALDSLINFCFLITQTYFLYVTYIRNFYLLIFTSKII